MLTRYIFIGVNKISNANFKEIGICLILSYSFRYTDTKIRGLFAVCVCVCVCVSVCVCVCVFRDLFDIPVILDII